MAPVIWGLDLNEITWAKFGNKNMWSNRYHLRRTKIILYQLAMIFCVVSESLGTAAMTDYLDQKEWIEHLDDKALEYNQDYVGIASYNIFSGVFVAFILGAAFFFDLIWPERHESAAVRMAWRVCSILAVLFEGGAAFALTIITATGTASVSGVGSERAKYLLTQAKYSPLKYRENGRAIAAVVFIWPGWLCVIASCIILWMSIANVDQHGTTVAAHIRNNGKTDSMFPVNGSEEYRMDKPDIVSQLAPTYAPGATEQPLNARTGPSFEADTTAAISGIRRSFDGNSTSDIVGHPHELAGSQPFTNADRL